MEKSGQGNKRRRPLEGVRVVEMGQLIAGPFCGQLLGDFGADVIKLLYIGVVYQSFIIY